MRMGVRAVSDAAAYSSLHVPASDASYGKQTAAIAPWATPPPPAAAAVTPLACGQLLMCSGLTNLAALPCDVLPWAVLCVCACTCILLLPALIGVA